MTPHHSDDAVTLYHGDCLDVLRELPDASVDAVVTDPPYGLEFMGKDWDKFRASNTGPQHTEFKNLGPLPTFSPNRRNQKCPDCGKWAYDHPGRKCECGGWKQPAQLAYVNAFQSWCEQWAAECLRVLKPGGHMLAFGGTRTWHRLACAVEDAGFEVRDSIAWLYGSGFPKSLDVSKAIDRAAGAEREPDDYTGPNGLNRVFGAGMGGGRTLSRADAATAAAATWQGWGTALKPAHEPIVVARKPLTGTVAQNVLQHGTGALNIDACRIDTNGEQLSVPQSDPANRRGEVGKAFQASGDAERNHSAQRESIERLNTMGRWPANVVLDESQAAQLDQQSGISTSSGGAGGGKLGANTYGKFANDSLAANAGGLGDTGGASRFFYVPKAPTDQRPRVPKEGAGEGRVIGRTIKRCRQCGNQTIRSGAGGMPACGHDDPENVTIEKREEHVAHPTVKPVDLIRWLVRLVTPPGGLVLDPFAGSGTTGEACIIEGFRCVLVEREAEYLPLIVARVTKPIQPDLFGGAA